MITRRTLRCVHNHTVLAKKLKSDVAADDSVCIRLPTPRNFVVLAIFCPAQRTVFT